MIIFLILAGDSKQWSPGLLAEVAVLLTHDNQGDFSQSKHPHITSILLPDSVESAGVPKGLQSLAEKIRKLSNWREEFCQSSPEEAEQWLRGNLELGEFLNNFGHRCLKEFELRSERWEENLRPVVTTLQAMLSVNPSSTESQSQSQVSPQIAPGAGGDLKLFQRFPLTKEDIIGRLPLGKRLGLKLLLPLAHSSTANREASKSLLIRLSNSQSQSDPQCSAGPSGSSGGPTAGWGWLWRSLACCRSQVWSGSSLTRSWARLSTDGRAW